MPYRFANGLNPEQLNEVCIIANELPPFSEDLSEIDLLKHTLAGSIIDTDGNRLKGPENDRQAQIIQGRFKLLMNIDICGTATPDHYTRLEYYAKEVWREAGKSEHEIRQIFAEECDDA
ncbi:hypothetical protein [Mycolicibacterium chlorophenolicum]|uniref:hypothetical protein n=1 Tax=Mycolicibacterium chlorophenolicum TaxID=37916 RepID=UPI001301897B|nr:hypothetical protein [Mycolicibacterium chlorophenolicum]